MTTTNKIISQFDDITTERIIEYSKNLGREYLYSKKPKEILKTEYQYGQTIILKGEEKEYRGLMGFWLSSQAWYSDGEDSAYASLHFDDLTSYNDWQLDINRIGVCKKLQSDKLSRVCKHINHFFSFLEVK